MSLDSLIVPESLDEVVEDALTSLSGFDNVNATVISIDQDAARRHRRRLQSSLNILCSIETTVECHLSSQGCNDLATKIIAGLNETLATSVADGTLSGFIQQEGATRNIGALASATILPDSYTFTSSDSVLNDPVIVSNPETVQSSATLMMLPIVTWSLLVSCTFLISA